jgi:hypothetical protein
MPDAFAIFAMPPLSLLAAAVFAFAAAAAMPIAATSMLARCFSCQRAPDFAGYYFRHAASCYFRHAAMPPPMLPLAAAADIDYSPRRCRIICRLPLPFAATLMPLLMMPLPRHAADTLSPDAAIDIFAITLTPPFCLRHAAMPP